MTANQAAKKKAAMAKNELRTLRNIDRHKGALEPAVVARLQQKGLITMSGESSQDLSIDLTDAGRALLSQRGER